MVSLDIYRQTQNGVARGGAGQKYKYRDIDGGDDPRTFMMTFLAKSGPRP